MFSYILGPGPYLHADSSPIRPLRHRLCHSFHKRGKWCLERVPPPLRTGRTGFKAGTVGSLLDAWTSLCSRPSLASASSSLPATALAPSAQSCGPVTWAGPGGAEGPEGQQHRCKMRNPTPWDGEAFGFLSPGKAADSLYSAVLAHRSVWEKNFPPPGGCGAGCDALSWTTSVPPSP